LRWGEVVRTGNCFAATRRLRAALLTSSALALAWMLPATPSHAQDATWLASPGSGDFDTGANWSTATVPTGTAFFGTSSTTGLSFSQNPTTVGGWTFNAGASNYTFTNGNVLNFTGAGIVINGGSATIISNSILTFQNSSTAGSATITNNVDGLFFFNSSTAGSAAITNSGGLHFGDTSTAGSASITNNLNTTFQNTSTAGNATITNNSTLTFQDSSTAGGAAIINNAGAIVDFSSTNGPSNDHKISAGSIAGAGLYVLGANELTVGSNNLSTEVSGVIAGAGGSLVKVGTGTLTLSGTNAYTGGTTVNSGLINFNTASSFGSGAITLNGGGLQWASGTSTDISSRLAAIGSNGATFDTNGSNVSFGTGLFSGTGGITKAGAGTLTFLAANSYIGATIVTGGMVQAGAANVFSANSLTTVNAGGTLDLGGFAQTIGTVSLAGGTIQNGSLTGAVSSRGGTINGLGGLLNLTTTAGTTIVTGTNSFMGSTTVNGGVLDVLGTLSDPTINSGGTLTGTGSVGATQVNAGGIFSPGNGTPGTSMTVTGNLAFQSGAIYLVQVNPSTASFANVSGSATLGGATVNAVFASGSYVSKRYTILTAAGGVSGIFGSLTGTNLPSNFKTSLSYDATNAYLNLGLNFTTPPTPGPTPPSLSGNQQVVGNALSNFFNTTGGIPLVFGTLTAAGLTQASGESATGAQQTTFQAMSQFLGLLTDPFMGRGSGFGGATSPTGYADEGDQASAYAARKTDAFAMFTKEPLAKVYEPRWSVWAAGYGGSQSTSGNAATGSNDTTSRIAGTAVGADYLFSQNTLAGFAIAGGGTSFGVNNLGSGRSDLFQAGAYVRHTNGPAYITAALAYGWQDVTTNRTLSIAGLDQLRAEFNANAYSGRVEGGYRFVVPVIGGIGITPYAAGQFTTFDLPAYAESVVSGTSNFALNYAAKSVTDGRSELGFRTDKSFAVQNGVLTLRSRLAWAHDFSPTRAVAATFQALPGASFVVNGAAQASDSALTTASAEMNWTNGWSAAATFEGEFSNVTQSYAGKGVVRYAW
jgi:autotransporter-associated beta strand protein